MIGPVAKLVKALEMCSIQVPLPTFCIYYKDINFKQLISHVSKQYTTVLITRNLGGSTRRENHR